MSTEYRILNHNDCMGVSDLVARSRYVNTATMITQPPLHRNWVENANNIGFVFGEFENGELRAALFTLVSPNQFCWFASYPVYDRNAEFPNELLAFAHQHYYIMGYKRFMVGDHLRVFDAEKLKERLGIQYIVEARLDPNVRPKASDLWEYLMVRELYPDFYQIYHFFEE